MNICFISNMSLTYFYEKIAAKLKARGYDIYWICVNKDLYNYLIERYPTTNVLLVNKSYCNEENEIIGEFKLNELIYGDRSLKHNMDWATKYLSNIQRPIYNFILNHKIRFIFGEVTWAHEILIHRICTQKKELDCKYLIPHDIRIPSKNFSFFEDEFWSKMYSVKTPVNKLIHNTNIETHNMKHTEIIQALIKDRNSFNYLYKKLISFVTKKYRDEEDPTWGGISRSLSLKLNMSHFINKVSYIFVKKISLQNVKEINKKIILVALHKQPEASIDNMGRYYENQLVNILNIWRIMPSGYILLIKEHHIAVGDRSWLWFRSLLDLPDVHCVDEKVASNDLFPFTEVVVTVSGTIGYEASLKGINTLTFAPVFYECMENVHHITLGDLKYCKSFNDLFIDKNNKMDTEEFKGYIAEHSFEGLISNPLSTQECMTKENIDNIVYAFELLLDDQI